jgi:hypothetical protein
MPLYQFSSVNDSSRSTHVKRWWSTKFSKSPIVVKAGLIFLIALIATLYVLTHDNTDKDQLLNTQHDPTMVIIEHGSEEQIKKKKEDESSTPSFTTPSFSISCAGLMSSGNHQKNSRFEAKSFIVEEEPFLWPSPSSMEWFGTMGTTPGAGEEGETAPASLVSLSWALSPQFSFKTSYSPNGFGSKVLTKSCSRVCESLWFPRSSQLESSHEVSFISYYY